VLMALGLLCTQLWVHGGIVKSKYNVKKVLKLNLWKVILLKDINHFIYVNILESLKFLSVKLSVS
jgi:hypothetical protein